MFNRQKHFPFGSIFISPLFFRSLDIWVADVHVCFHLGEIKINKNHNSYPQNISWCEQFSSGCLIILCSYYGPNWWFGLCTIRLSVVGRFKPYFKGLTVIIKLSLGFIHLKTCIDGIDEHGTMNWQDLSNAARLATNLPLMLGYL